MRRSLVFIWIAWFSIGFMADGHAAFVNLPVGARMEGLAGVASVVMDGPEAVFGNPALLGSTNSTACMFDASRLFGLAALNRSAFAAAFKAAGVGIGMGFQTFGSSLYRENTAVLSTGLTVGKAGIGLSVRALQLSIVRYGETKTWTLDAGIGLHATKDFLFGASASNLLNSKLGADREAIPRTIRLGFAISWSSDALLCLEAVKDERFPVDLRSGFELKIRPMDVRVGFGTSPSSWTWGFGIRLGPLRVDFAVSEHPVLGATRHVSVLLGKTKR